MSADNMKSLLQLFESAEQKTKQQLNEGIDQNDDLTENAGAPNQQAHQLAQEALSAAVRYIQDELNVSEEDEEIAYEYFRDENADTVLNIFVDYIEHQVDAQHNGDAPPYDDEELDEGEEYPLNKDGKYDDATLRKMFDAMSDEQKETLRKHLFKKKDASDETNENFGGGMRDRPGSDTKSFDLAECKAFLAKRVLKG